MSLLQASGLRASRGPATLFRDVSFTVAAGEWLAVRGPNGSGKTTLLRILLGDEQPDAGTVQRGHLVEFGYYDQHLKTLPEDKPVIRAVWPLSIHRT